MLTRLLRLPEVKQQTGLSRSSIYAKMAEGTFPLTIRISNRAVAWIEEEIQAWIRKQIGNKPDGDLLPEPL